MTIEVVKFWQASLINSDLDMYYAPTDTSALCRTSSLVEELGQIAYIFSDKTGTLTCNEMEFRECSIYGTMYAQIVDDAKREQGQKSFDTLKQKALEDTPEAVIVRELSVTGYNCYCNLPLKNPSLSLSMLAVCHTVIPEERDGKMIFQASSPDEAALVSGAEILGYRFHVSQ